MIIKTVSILFLVAAIFTDQAALKVIVQNVQVGKGGIVVEVYDSENSFLKRPIASKTLNANSNVMEFLFNIPPGTYAIAVYQDLNDNKKLDAGLFHIPKEPYGFSNNYRPKFSAPSYKDCLIKVTGMTTSVINLK
jgi:uncharacterized protein (DUF2141 family)